MPRLALLLLAYLLFSTVVMHQSALRDGHDPAILLKNARPDPSKAVQLRDWASKEQSDRFHSVKGLTRGQILRTIGHPYSVVKRADGREVWHYLWGVDWEISLVDGVCTFTHSNDGY